jgi:hypothetical protein
MLRVYQGLAGCGAVAKLPVAPKRCQTP